MTWNKHRKEQVLAEAHSQVLRVRCADCRWSFRGRFLDARKAFQAHREAKHS